MREVETGSAGEAGECPPSPRAEFVLPRNGSLYAR